MFGDDVHREDVKPVEEVFSGERRKDDWSDERIILKLSQQDTRDVAGMHSRKD